MELTIRSSAPQCLQSQGFEYERLILSYAKDGDLKKALLTYYETDLF